MGKGGGGREGEAEDKWKNILEEKHPKNRNVLGELLTSEGREEAALYGGTGDETHN